jgi:predicted lipoprotein with Yx(FWY)xxD motif
MRRLPSRVGGLTVLAAFGLVAAGCGGAIPSSNGSQATVTVMSSHLGRFLADGQGHTLYLFDRDEPRESYCNGACAAVWPPYETDGPPQAVAGVPASALGTIKRDDGDVQVTYRGHPLYFYAADASTSGKTKGEGVDQFGAEWYVVGRDGKPVEPADTSSGGSDKSNNGGGGGY